MLHFSSCAPPAPALVMLGIKGHSAKEREALRTNSLLLLIIITYYHYCSCRPSGVVPGDYDHQHRGERIVDYKRIKMP